MASDLLTTEELAAYLRVQPSTVKEWARQRRIPELRLSPHVRRFRLDEVLRALRPEAETVAAG